MVHDYLDFELSVEAVPDGYAVTVVRSPAGEAKETVAFPYGELALENRLKDLKIALLSSGGGFRRSALTEEEASVKELGSAFFDFLLAGEVRSLFNESKREAERNGRGLRLKLRVDAPELAALPWEFLHDPRSDDYLSLASDTPLVRYLPVAQPLRPLTVTPPLRILGMVASPRGYEPLNVALEQQRVERALADLQGRGLMELTWLEGGSWRALQREMRRSDWHIFHFIGHGGFDKEKDEGFLAFVDESGEAERIHASQLARLLDKRSLRLALLNACEGARGGQYDVFSSTAATLAQRSLPAVVAMQYAISDRAAVEFARSFYEALADGLPVDAAVTEARVAMITAHPNSVEWGTPVLYMRATDGRLFEWESFNAETQKRREEEERQKVAEAQKRREEEEQQKAAETQRLKEEEERQKAAEAQRFKEEEEKQKATETQRFKDEEEKQKATETQKRREEEERQKAAEAQRLKEEEDRRKVAETQRLKEEGERQKAAEAQKRRDEEEKQKAAETQRLKEEEEKRKAAETQKRRDEEEKQKAAEAQRLKEEEEKRKAAEAQKRREKEKSGEKEGTRAGVKMPAVIVRPPIEFDWVTIPAGEFTMGSQKAKKSGFFDRLLGNQIENGDPMASDDETPQHTLYLPEYRIARVPVTNAQYLRFAQATKYKTPEDWTDGRIPDGKQEHPVVNVSWHDAIAFCDWAKVQLPSEAQWEKAARGTDGRIWPWGNQAPDKTHCNFNSNVGDTTPVGAYPAGASPYGVLDMAGNVWEWTRSLWANYPYRADDGREDFGRKENERRVLRGGSFLNYLRYGVRCAYRFRLLPDLRPWYNGFRLLSPGS